MKQKRMLFIAILLGGLMSNAAASTSKIYQIPVKTIEGKETTLAEYQGKTLLVVNVASKCGFTHQYEGLETLYQKYKDRGLVVLGFPANNFMFQEPGSDADIKKFCSLKYNVTFPMFSKIDVKGKEMHPLYRYLTEESEVKAKIGWNFNKYLVNSEGRVIAHFDSKTEPLSEELTAKLETALSPK